MATAKELTDKYIMNTYARFDLELEKGEGCVLYDEKGRSYLDFASGIAVNNLGYNNTKIISAIASQAEKLIHVSNYFYTAPQALLAEKLCENSFADRVFFCNSGAEAVEGAIKLARIHAKKISGNGHKIITMNGSFHGRTYGALSATSQEKYHKGFEPLLPGFTYVDFGDLKAAADLVKGGEYCAVIIEPVQGEGGVNIVPEAYLKGIRDLTSKNGMLLISDEVQVGLGRTGTLFAYMNYGVEPDIMTLAKPLAGGLPIGAVLAREEVAKAFEPGNHASTFGGGPLVAAVANAFFDEITKEGFLDEVKEKSKYIAGKLLELKSKFPGLIKDIRSIGLISAVEFFDLKARAVAEKLIENGFLTTAVQEKVLRLTPPLVIERGEIDLIISALGKILAEQKKGG